MPVIDWRGLTKRDVVRELVRVWCEMPDLPAPDDERVEERMGIAWSEARAIYRSYLRDGLLQNDTVTKGGPICATSPAVEPGRGLRVPKSDGNRRPRLSASGTDRAAYDSSS